MYFLFSPYNLIYDIKDMLSNIKVPLILICRPPSQEVSDVNKGKGVLD